MILLDTNILIWLAQGHPRIGKKMESDYFSGHHALCFSPVSLWEIAIKKSKKKLEMMPLPSEFSKILKLQGYQILPLVEQDFDIVASLQPVHKDPFDRLLIAQALIRGFQILTSDKIFKKYPVDVILV